MSVRLDSAWSAWQTELVPVGRTAWRARRMLQRLRVRVRRAERQCRRQVVACVDFVVVEADRRITHRELVAALRVHETDRCRTELVAAADAPRALRFARNREAGQTA